MVTLNDDRRDESVLDQPLYTAAEAAQSLGIPAATVRSWVRGRHYRTSDGLQRFERIIATPDDAGALSFRNLVEVQLLRALRVDHQIRIDVIRKAIRFMRAQLGIDHPLASGKMRHDGKRLFADFLDATLDTATGQTILLPAIEEHLNRVEFKRDEPARIYPFPRTGPLGLKAVVLDPAIRHGQAVLAGTRIPLHVVSERHAAGDSVKSIARDYGRKPKEIELALRYAA